MYPSVERGIDPADQLFELVNRDVIECGKQRRLFAEQHFGWLVVVELAVDLRDAVDDPIALPQLTGHQLRAEGPVVESQIVRLGEQVFDVGVRRSYDLTHGDEPVGLEPPGLHSLLQSTHAFGARVDKDGHVEVATEQGDEGGDVRRSARWKDSPALI